MDKASVREFKRALREYEKAMGVSIEDGIIDMAQSTCRRLAHTVPPFGLSSAVGEKFVKSIGAQIDRAWYGANVGAYSGGTMESVHAQARNVNGVVPKRKFRTFKKFTERISVAEKEQYKRKVVKRAGIAKAAYLAAAQKIKALRSNVTGKKTSILSGVAKWIKEDVNAKLGDSQTKRNGLNTEVSVTNLISYIQKIHKSSMVEKAMEQGRKNGTKRMSHIINKTKRTV